MDIETRNKRYYTIKRLMKFATHAELDLIEKCKRENLENERMTFEGEQSIVKVII